MKTPGFLSLVLMATLCGCTDSANKSAPQTNAAAGGSVLTAPVDYLDAVSKGQQQAVKTIDTAAISSAIQLFQVEHGRFPRNLDELVKEKFLTQIPQAPYGSKIVYDATTGQVKVVKQ
jgi:hypothetical protein